MKNQNNLTQVYTLSKYSNYYLLLTIVIGILLVFFSTFLQSTESIVNYLETISHFANLLNIEYLSVVDTILETIMSTSDQIAMWLTIIGVAVVGVVLLVLYLIQVISHILVKREVNKGSTITRRIFVILFNIFLLYFAFQLLTGATLYFFIGLDFILTLMLILYIAMKIYSLYLLVVDTYVQFKEHKYEQKLFFIGILKFFVVVVVILSGLKLLLTYILYSLAIETVDSINYFTLIQLDDVIVNVITELDTYITNNVDLPFLTDIVFPNIIEFLQSEYLDSFVVENLFNEYVANFINGLVSSLFVQTLINLSIVVVSSILMWITSFKIEKHINNLNYVYAHIVVSIVTIGLVLYLTPFSFALPIGIIMMILTLVHFYEFIVKYDIFNVTVEKFKKNNLEDGNNE